MFKKAPNTDPDLNVPINNVLTQMANFSAEDEEYAKMVDQLSKLYKLKELDKPQRVSADTWALIGGNLLGIMLIVGHERAHVVTSKALTFVGKLK
jgi:hypothetical protein